METKRLVAGGAEGVEPDSEGLLKMAVDALMRQCRSKGLNMPKAEVAKRARRIVAKVQGHQVLD